MISSVEAACSWLMAPVDSMALEISLTASFMSFSVCWIFSVASRDCSASLRTSSATTAKPRPCSPARAASMAAFRPRRFVWPAMPLMKSMTFTVSVFFSFSVFAEAMDCCPASASSVALRATCSTES